MEFEYKKFTVSIIKNSNASFYSITQHGIEFKRDTAPTSDIENKAKLAVEYLLYRPFNVFENKYYVILFYPCPITQGAFEVRSKYKNERILKFRTDSKQEAGALIGVNL